MKRYITLGADEDGQVYGLALGEDGRWRRNPLGLSTSCAVIRPVTKRSYEYMTEDPQSVKEWWQAAVQDGKTELGLADWFEGLDKDDLMDTSYVFELLDDNDNPVVAGWQDGRMADGDREFESFRPHAEAELVKSPKVTAIKSEDDVYEWEASGFFPPKKPFVVEFAPKGLLEGYYAHLRETHGEFEG